MGRTRVFSDARCVNACRVGAAARTWGVHEAIAIGRQPRFSARITGFAPEAELHTTGQFADQGVYRGRAGLQRYWAEIREDIEEMSLSISDLRAIGDRVFFAVTGRGRGRRSEVPVEQPMWLITTLRDGLAVRVETYVDPTEALDAAGLRE